MQVIIPKTDLLRLVSRAVGIADKKSTMPALSCVLLDAGERLLTVSATDLYLSVRSSASCEGKEPGKIAAPAKELFDRVKALPDGPVEIKSNTGDALKSVTVRSVSAKRRFTIHAIQGDEFPQLPAAPKEGASLALSLLFKLINRTHFAISPDETRPNLNSCLAEADETHIRMVATDGHRLAKAEVEHAGASMPTMLLPKAAIEMLRRLQDDLAAEESGDDPAVDLFADGRNVFVRAGSLVFSCKLVDAQFPPYKQVIPEHTERQIRVPRAQFADALRAVSIAAGGRDSAVTLTVEPSVLRFESNGPDTGEGVDELPVEYVGKQLRIGFNSRSEGRVET